MQAGPYRIKCPATFSDLFLMHDRGTLLPALEDMRLEGSDIFEQWQTMLRLCMNAVARRGDPVPAILDLRIRIRDALSTESILPAVQPAPREDVPPRAKRPRADSDTAPPRAATGAGMHSARADGPAAPPPPAPDVPDEPSESDPPLQTGSTARGSIRVCKPYNERGCSEPCPDNKAHVCDLVVRPDPSGSHRVCGGPHRRRVCEHKATAVPKVAKAKPPAHAEAPQQQLPQWMQQPTPTMSMLEASWRRNGRLVEAFWGLFRVSWGPGELHRIQARHSGRPKSLQDAETS